MTICVRIVGSPGACQLAEDTDQQVTDDPSLEPLAQSESALRMDSGTQQPGSRKRWREDLHEQLIQVLHCGIQ